MGHNLNITHEKIPELFDWINTNPYEEIGRLKAEEAAARRKPQWRLRYRLTERDIIRQAMAFETGIAAKELAQRFGISISSVKRLMRKQKAKRSRREESA